MHVISVSRWKESDMLDGIAILQAAQATAERAQAARPDHPPRPRPRRRKKP
jgi:hypothetical protein